jgi:putative transposase
MAWIKGKRLSAYKFGGKKAMVPSPINIERIDSVVKYILNQKEHHKRKSFKDEYSDILEKNDVVFNPEYLFDFFDK